MQFIHFIEIENSDKKNNSYHFIAIFMSNI